MSVFHDEFLKRRDLDDRRRFFCLSTRGGKSEKVTNFARLEPFMALSLRLFFNSFEI